VDINGFLSGYKRIGYPLYPFISYPFTSLPKGRTVISCKWVLRRKFNVNDGSITRKKARLVIKGYE